MGVLCLIYVLSMQYYEEGVICIGFVRRSVSLELSRNAR